MPTATAKKKTETPDTPLPITFDEINRRKVRERIEGYRDIVHRRANGATVTVEDMERAAELLELLGLPQYTFDRDVQAVQRFKAVSDKVQAAVDAVPANKQRAAELSAEIDATRAKLETLKEQHRLAVAAMNKPAAYTQSVAMLQHDHPHVIGDLDQAVQLRIEELDRRKQIGGAA